MEIDALRVNITKGVRKMKIKKRVLISVVLCLLLCFAFTGNALAFYNFPQVSIGATGSYTRCIQNVIKYNHTNLYVDGIFGPTTQNAVKAFQSSNGLSADGIVGWRTWDALCSKLSGDMVGYYQYNHRIRKSNGSYTTTIFFYEQDYLNPSWHEHWRVYVAAPGTDPGTWYNVNY